MLFNSYIFIFVFLPITLLGYYGIVAKKLQLWFLFFASLFFYFYWSKTFVFLLLFTVILDFYLARIISAAEEPRKRKALVTMSIASNLTVLGFFKYYNFFVGSVNDTAGFFGHSAVLPHLDIILPIGVSFYTFQSMSYVIDVYRRTSSAHGRLLEFASYVTLFPHQISGPLVRHNVIVPQLENPLTYNFHAENFWEGCNFFVLGLAKKMLLADRLSPPVTAIVHNMAVASNAEAILALLGYTFQLYFDFSGYSDMAVGLGKMMNIQFPQNFNSPYKSQSITEFWRRWHITLSSWLRDYLYISLGGNRDGAWKTYRNLLLTMAIGGLWHGANWVYMIWGIYHGALLAVERLFKDRGWRGIASPQLRYVLTFIAIAVGWAFFRSPDLATAILWIKKCFFLDGHVSWQLMDIAPKFRDRFFVALGVAMLIGFFSPNTFEVKHRASWQRALILAILFLAGLLYMNEESPFLYFQF